MRTSVRSVTGCPSCSSRCTKPVTGSTVCHTGSVRRPSIIGGVVTTCARAMGSEAPWVAERGPDTSRKRTSTRSQGPLVRQVTAHQFRLIVTNEQATLPGALMTDHTRREFLQTTAAIGLGIALAPGASAQTPAPAGGTLFAAPPLERVRIGFVGEIGRASCRERV